MSDHKRRINKLEKDAGPGDELPWLIMTQDYDDTDLYHANDGNDYRRGQFPELEKEYQVIAIEYGPWPPGAERDPDKIQLKWPEDD
jgi:hypothetical protein